MKARASRPRFRGRTAKRRPRTRVSAACSSFFRAIFQLIYAATDNQLVRSMLRIFASFVDQFHDASTLDETPEIDVRSQLEVGD